MIPEKFRRPESARIIHDGIVLGHWLTIGGGLFDPETRRWIPIPAPRPASARPSTRNAESTGGYRVAEKACRHLGGSENLFRLCDPPTRIKGGTALSVAEGSGPGTVEVLRVRNDAREAMGS